MHPVLSPSGEILTRGFPLTKVDARGYGCFAANPLGQFDFQKGTGIKNPQRRILTLKPGESALFKFRMIIYEGMRDKEKSDKDFKKYSKS